ncbi:hypothetical protein HYALB_00013438 [Hymenoscyphus albidus]|uniref:galacturonan 1,4-alpha-galacturonidase n=1 Tax=Hymenoscyphus albidus TaxID=595503 RepID=A0A9N9LQF6_9HELO|nr:hypothetical protein HYALB_00013438 [Hymenoscyphus albidus]
MTFKFSSLLPIVLISALATFCVSAEREHSYSGPSSIDQFRHHHPYHHPPLNHRPKFYIRASRNDTDDVSGEFYRGMKKANHGGTLVLPKNQTFVIGKKLDLTFLKNIEVQLEGEIKFTNNITYWQNDYFYHPFQKTITFWKWGGENIKIFGNGTLNGNGQSWYDGFAGLEILNPNNTYLRPVLFYAENATDLYIEGIRFTGSPCWTNFLNLPKNTDGWDSYNVDGLTVRNSWVNIGDDCFSPKPNTSNILVENIYCNGTHGISMGSIGQYDGIKDYIYNAHIENVTMLNAQNGARLKGWAGPNVGYGFIQNITFKNFYNFNVDWPIVLDACYFNINTTTCAQYPSRVDMIDITFSNFTGSSSGKNGRKVGELVCSPNAVCSNIKLDGIDLTSPMGSPPVIVCDGIQGGIGVDCLPANSTLAARHLNRIG